MLRKILAVISAAAICHIQATPLQYYETGLWGVTSTENQPHPDASATVATQQTLFMTKSSRLALDLRAKIDISQTDYHELNLGLGQRHTWDTNSHTMIGYYGFWDVTHIQDQVFMQQATLGVEWLNPTHHINANLYLPRASFTTDLVSTTSSTPIRAFGKNAFIVSDAEHGLVSIKAPPGWDINLEKRLSLAQDKNLSLQLGYQYFNKKDFIAFQGPKASIGIQDIQGKNQRSIETFASYDSFYGTTLGLTMKMRRTPNKFTHYSPQEKLYLQPIKRDIDVKITNLPAPSSADDFETMKAREVEMINTLFNLTILHTDNSHDLDDRKQLLKDGIIFQEESYIDGKRINLTKLYLRGVITEEYAYRTSKEQVQKNMTHRAIWEKNLTLDKPFLMVIEDSLMIRAELYERMAQFIHDKKYLDYEVIFPGHDLNNPNRPVSGAYIVQTQALPKLIRETKTWHDDLAIQLINPKHDILYHYTEQNWF